MRKLLLTFLMATTAAAVTTPTLAQRADRDTSAEERAKERDERRAKQEKARTQRTDAREARPERVEQPQRVDRTKPAEKRQQNVRVRDQRQDARQQNVRVREQVRDRRATNVDERGRPTIQQRQQSRAATVQQRQQQREQVREQRVDSRERFVDRANQARRLTPPANARPDRPAPPPQTATNHRSPTWSTTHWRNDRRYDWRRYRDRNRSHFRLGVYFDPFGWNYRRYNVGWRLWPSYYSSNNWLNDPYMYRLPYAPWPYKWVRYYDDALLVNTFTGQVADVIYDFFW